MPGGAPAITWHSDTSISVEGVRYDLQYAPDTEPGTLRLFKTRALIEGYAPIIDEFTGANIIELGIFGGGSTGFFAQLCRPNRLVAVELDGERIATLDALIDRLGLTERVSLHYGVDQADRDRLSEIVDTSFEGEPVDLVIDDASHLYGPTRASFEVLFPRLRPGGLYVIEDWRSQDWFIRMFTALVAGPPNAALDAVELGMAANLADPDGIESHPFEHWFSRIARDPAAPHHRAVRTWFDGLPAKASPAASTIHERLTRLLEEEPPPSGAAAPPTMGTIAAELCMGMKSGHPALAEVTLGPNWITARRGVEPLVGSFSLDDVAADPFAILAPHSDGLPPPR